MRKLAPILLLVVLAGCAAGDGSQWAQNPDSPAGFFVGLWHGALMLVTLVVSFFTKDVGIYETINTGVAYDIGFVLGVFAVYGSGCSISSSRKKSKKATSGDDLGEQIERKIKAKVERFIEEDEDEWKELGEKVEKKIKAKLRRWLEDD